MGAYFSCFHKRKIVVAIDQNACFTAISNSSSAKDNQWEEAIRIFFVDFPSMILQ